MVLQLPVNLRWILLQDFALRMATETKKLENADNNPVYIFGNHCLKNLAALLKFVSLIVKLNIKKWKTVTFIRI